MNTEAQDIQNIIMKGRQLLDARRYQESITQFELALSMNRDSADAHVGLCLGYANIGEHSKALSAVTESIRVRPDNKAAQRLFLNLLRSAGPAGYSNEIEQILARCLQDPQMAVLAGPLAVLQTYQKHGLGREDGVLEKTGNGLPFGFLTDDLFLLALEKTVIRNWRIEQLLTYTRKWLLRSGPQLSFQNEKLRRFCICFAYQCIRNDYVFYRSEEELAALATISDETSRLPGPGVEVQGDIEYSLMIWMMYAPLYHHPERKHLLETEIDKWSPDIRGLIASTLLNKAEEDELESGILSLGTPSNTVSRLVQEQYESFPYPRWVELSSTGVDTRQRLAYTNPRFPAPAYLNEAPSILVAGAGTGQHPILVAMSEQNARVTALDLSGASLAYGARMARQLGVRNIEFVQGDILDIERLNRSFDVIQCSGVLHHMEDPVLGWSRLVSVLRDKGLIKIALYSESARSRLIPIRQAIRERGYGDSADDIRAFRHDIIEAVSSGRDSMTANALEMADFYVLSDCRDLLFNVQEKRFTLPAIKSALSRLGLTFIGMEGKVPGQTLARLKQAGCLPADARVDDLDVWENLERQAPDTFARMYQMWCTR